MRLILGTIEKEAGTTFKATWCSSGAVASPILSTLRDASETLVSSVAATASGDGRYYAFHSLPNSPQWLVNEWIATVNANTYVSRQLVRVVKPEVD